MVKVGDENAGVAQKAFGKSSQQTFSIFVDADTQLHKAPVLSHMEDMVEDDAENRMPSLSDAVMRLPTIPQPQSRVPGGKDFVFSVISAFVPEDDESWLGMFGKFFCIHLQMQITGVLQLCSTRSLFIYILFSVRKDD